MMASTPRPEDRRRRVELAVWLDTLPFAFRSEGFAEDLRLEAGPAAELCKISRRRPVWGATAAVVLGLTRGLWSPARS